MKRVHLLSSTADMGFTVQQVRAGYAGSEVWVREAELDRLREALDNLLDAITAEDRFGDRSLTIQGSTASLKWLLEAQDDARAALAALDGEDGE